MQLSVGIAEELILPTLRAIENDLYPGANATKSRIYAQLRELIEEMTVEGSTQLEPALETSTPKQPATAIVPFMGECDEIVGRVIAPLLAAKGIDSDLFILANASRGEGGTSEGVKNPKYFGLRD